MTGSEAKRLLEEVKKIVRARDEAIDGPASFRQSLDAVVRSLELHQERLENQNKRLRETELALRETRKRYFDLFQQAPMAYLTLERDGRISEVNLAAALLLTLTREDLVGRKLSRFVVAEDVAAFHAHQGQVLELGSRQACDVTLQCRDGQRRPVRLESIAAPSSEGTRNQVRVAILDLTEISQAVSEVHSRVEELHRTKARFQNVAQSMTDSLVVVSPDGLIEDANASALTLLGYSAAELEGKPFASIIERGDEVDVESRVLADLRGGAIVGRSEKTYVGKDGRHIPVLFTGSPVRNEAGEIESIACLAQDISKLKQTEEEARLAVEASPIAMLMVDERHKIVSVNAKTESLFGYDRSELLGDLVEKLVPHNLRHVHRRRSMEFMQEPDKKIMGRGRDLHGRRKDGSVVPVEITLSPFEAPDGKRVLAAIVDLSERKQLEEQMRQAQKMEAIGTLASGVAHDFNNILMGVSGCARIAASTLEAGSPAHAYLDEIKASTESGAAISRQLLSFSRKSRQTPTVFELGSVVSAAAPMLRRLLGEDVELVVDCTAANSRVSADVGQMQQVLINLAVNARDAMPSGGRLSVKCRAVLLDAANEHGLAAGQYVALEVSDTGSGMSASTKQRIFDPFFTTKEVGRGTGLGLSTVYAIIEQAGGQIRVTSTLGRGTTFTVLLPETGGPITADLPVPSDDPSDERHGVGTVLVVEDERMVRMAARFYLEQGGYRVLEASSGAEGIDWCKQYQDQVDLLLTDVVLPGMGGSEIAAEIRRLRPGIKVLFMSAHSPDALVEKGRLESGQTILQKPFGPEDLLEIVKGLLEDESGRGQGGAATTVLVAEDERLIRLTLCEQLKSVGFNVLDAEDGEAAVKVARKYGSAIDVLLCDVRLPKKSGREVAEAVQVAAPSVITIFMSGLSRELAVGGELMPPDGLMLQKPIGAVEIEKEIKRLVKERSGRH